MSARPAPLRIALLHHSYWPEVRRGTERFIRDLADGLIERGHRPTLITSHPGAPSRTVEDGLEVVRNWRPPEGRLRRRGWQPHLSHLPFSALSLRRGDFDLAHALYPTDALVAVRWSARTGRPAVVSFMGLPDRAGLVSARGRVETVRRVAARAAAVVSLSAAAAEAFRRELGVDTRVIEPGVDLELFRSSAPRAPVPTVFCPAAVGDERKRVRVLVEAFARVRERRPDAELVLSGPSEDEALVAAYSSAWVTALPSVAEAFGLVLVESLACGTPVVAADDGHPAALLAGRPEIGRLAAPDDVAALARALLEALELADAPETATRCRERAQELPRERCAEAYEALYREVRDGAGSKPGLKPGAG